MSSAEEMLSKQNIEMIEPGTSNPTSEDKPEVAEVEEPKEQLEEAPEPEDTKEKSIDDLPLPEEGKKEDKAIPKWVEKRLSKKEIELQQKEQEAASYKAELERLRNSQQPFNQQPMMDDIKREQFATDAQYIAAIMRKESERQKQEAFEEHQKSAMLNAELTFRKKWTDMPKEGVEKYDDFEEKFAVLCSDEVPGNRAMAEAIVDSQYKYDICVFLGNHKEKAIEIAKKNPIEAVKAIAAIEARFNERKKVSPATTAKPIDPVNTSRPKGETVSNMEDLVRSSEKMTQREFEAAVKQMTKKQSPW